MFLCWDCRALLAQLDVIEELLPRVLSLCSLLGAAAPGAWDGASRAGESQGQAAAPSGVLSPSRAQRAAGLWAWPGWGSPWCPVLGSAAPAPGLPSSTPNTPGDL